MQGKERLPGPLHPQTCRRSSPCRELSLPGSSWLSPTHSASRAELRRPVQAAALGGPPESVVAAGAYLLQGPS